MYKAIVESIINDGIQARVRIPFLNRTYYSKTATNTNDLPIASICTLPGCYPSVAVGDIVYVDFENNDDSTPVILGVLYRKERSNSTVEIHADKISASVSSELPKDTKINNADASNVGVLSNAEGNIQKQINELLDTNNSGLSVTVNEEVLVFVKYRDTSVTVDGQTLVFNV